MQANEITASGSERTNTLGYPSWLVALALILLPLRLVFNFYQSNRAPLVVPASELAAAHNVDNERPILYAFIRDDGSVSGELWRTLHDNRLVAGLVASRFNLIPVIDSETNSSENERLYKRYGIHMLPSLVVALPDGTRVKDVSGIVSSEVIYEWLKSAVKDEQYALGRQLLRNGHYAQAYAELTKYLDNVEPAAPHHCWAEYFRLLCLLEMKRQSEAQRLAQQLTVTDRHGTLAPVFRYVAGKSSSQEMIEKTSYDDHAHAAHLTLALKAFADGKRDQALTHLQWVAEHAGRGTVERAIAIDLLSHEFKEAQQVQPDKCTESEFQTVEQDEY